MEPVDGHLPDSQATTARLPPGENSKLATSTGATGDSISPAFWSTHGRTTSSVSYQSIRNLRPTPIRLEDNSDNLEQDKACWAGCITVNDYIVVSGATGIGAYVVWTCTVETLKGGPFTINKRYSEFDDLRINLVRAFPQSEASIPELPRKSIISRFRPKFLEHRKAGLSHFLNCVILNPEFSGSPIVKEFIFS